MHEEHKSATEGEVATPQSTRMQRVRDRASTFANRADSAVDTAASKVGTGLSGTARGIRSGADAFAHRLEDAGSYLDRSSGRDFMTDITNVMRNHPKATVGVGLALGFLLARRLRR